MPSAPSSVADKVAARGRWLNWYSLRMQRHGLSSRDLNQVFAGAFTSFFAFLERSIEDLFIGVVTNRIVYPQPAIRPLVTFASSAVARKVIYAGRAYADWLPYDLTRKRARVFLAQGRPFVNMPPADVKVLDSLGTLRNAISHDSKYAMTRFRENYVDGRLLPPDQRRPPGYLRGMHAADQTRLSFLFSEANAVMGRLCS